ncbi:radical SAM protein [candidate division KSB1 bacterium]|nr:MAG: radical SAM protein [candidate division KSB1 bacterium]
MFEFKPELVLIQKEVLKNSFTQRILKNLNGAEVIIIDSDKNEKFDTYYNINELINHSKRRIYIRKHKGRIIKKCPGTKGLICCNYYVATFAENCPFDCSYCFLQGYINNPFTSIYVNYEDFIVQFRELLARYPEYKFRIGTGEFTDSIALDEIMNINKELINLFKDKKNAILELKTKSSKIDSLLNEDHQGRTVISWSLNPQSIIDSEEKNCSSLDERIDSALKCQNAGYKIGFHFDPIIHYEGWENEYYDIINKISKKIEPSSIAWISLGTFRYFPSLKPIIKDRFPESKILYGEHIPCSDGKFRYIKPVRTSIYSKMLKWLNEYNNNIFVYLCMETREVWEKVFGWSPRCNLHLNELFDSKTMKISH